ncbi:MAG: lysophospholipid acyltransferase family protein [Desulfuromonadales bacterium]
MAVNETNPVILERPGPAALLMTLAVYPLLVLWTVVGIALSPLYLLLAKVGAGWPAGRIVRSLIWIYGRGWMLIVSPFVRFRRENLSAEQFHTPGIFVINHLSFFDTYCMALLPVFDITFAVRSWPFRIPGYAAFMRMAEYLDVERMNVDETLAAGRRIITQGGHLLFFPEGHRSRDGQMQRFYSGAFCLARQLGCPVYPLCITGTDRLLPPGRRWLRPTQVRLRALPPVDSTSFESHGDLRRKVKADMMENLQKMRADRGE